ncbi:MAG: hypothetical protein K5643_07180 [Saccharofermentans sp.]|nr:hypothetical protein [Saccharofermentans sp.]
MADKNLMNLSKEELKAQKIIDEFSDDITVEEIKHDVDELKVLVHGMWMLMKEKGIDYSELDAKLDIAAKLATRTDYADDIKCPSCGRGLQTMEKYVFKKMCYYCGYEKTQNPFQKYDGIDLNKAPESEEDEAAKAQQETDAEYAAAQEVLNTTFEPYDVTKDLNFDEQENEE